MSKTALLLQMQNVVTNKTLGHFLLELFTELFFNFYAAIFIKIKHILVN